NTDLALGTVHKRCPNAQHLALTSRLHTRDGPLAFSDVRRAIRMSAAAAPWSVKGIDPKAREIAKDLARRQGLTLGDWLNRMIEDSAGPGRPAGAIEAAAAAPFAADEFHQLGQTLDRLDA